MTKDIGGVWRTIGGRRIFIKDGEDLTSAMKRSGKFKNKKQESKKVEKKNSELTEEERKNKIEELEKKKEETQGIISKGAIQEEIDMVKDGFDDKEKYREYLSKEREKRLKEYEQEKKERDKLRTEQEKQEDDRGYKMAHRPNEDGPTADDLTKSQDGSFTMPKDFYNYPEHYFDMSKNYNKESYKVLKEIQGNPDATITIYRATPGDTINEGDWITLSKSYANHHKETWLEGKGNVVELKVKASDIRFAGDDINEFGYYPKKKK